MCFALRPFAAPPTGPRTKRCSSIFSYKSDTAEFKHLYPTTPPPHDLADFRAFFFPNGAYKNDRPTFPFEVYPQVVFVSLPSLCRVLFWTDYVWTPFFLPVCGLEPPFARLPFCPRRNFFHNLHYAFFFNPRWNSLVSTDID